jgi:hypothetical protein
MKYFLPFFNKHGISDHRQTDTHTAEPLVPEPSASEVEMAIEKEKDTYHQVMTKSQQN